jgi:hypothetical protein
LAVEVIATFDRRKALGFLLRTLLIAAIFVAAAAIAAWVLWNRPDDLRPKPGLWVVFALVIPLVAWFAWLPIVAVIGLRPGQPLVYVREGRLRYLVPIGVSVPIDEIERADIQDVRTGGRAIILSHSGGVTRVPLSLAREEEAVILQRVLSLAGLLAGAADAR